MVDIKGLVGITQAQDLHAANQAIAAGKKADPAPAKHELKGIEMKIGENADGDINKAAYEVRGEAATALAKRLAILTALGGIASLVVFSQLIPVEKVPVESIKNALTAAKEFTAPANGLIPRVVVGGLTAGATAGLGITLGIKLHSAHIMKAEKPADKKAEEAK